MTFIYEHLPFINGKFIETDFTSLRGLIIKRPVSKLLIIVPFIIYHHFSTLKFDSKYYAGCIVV